MTVWADKHEKPEIRNLVEASCDKVKYLDDFSADYATGGFLIERKDWAEVAGRIIQTDRDLYVQLEELVTAADELGVKPALLLEGEIGSRLNHSKMQPSHIAKYLAAIPLMGVTIIPSTGPRCSAEIIARYEDGSPPNVERVRGAPDRKGHERRFVIEGFPDVGPGKAEALLNHFGSVAGVMSASEEELEEADGIGPATASAIHEVMTREE